MGLHTIPRDTDPTATVLDSVRRIVQTLRVSGRAAEQQVGLTGAQLFVLRQLTAAEGPLSVNELAERTFTHQSSVSVVVQKLEKRGLIRRVRSADDARRLQLSPTPAGKSLMRKAPAAAQERLVAAMKSMQAGRRKALAELLFDLVGRIGDLDRSPPMFFEDGHSSNRKAKRRARS